MSNKKNESAFKWYWRTTFVEPAKNPLFWIIFISTFLIFVWMGWIE